MIMVKNYLSIIYLLSIASIKRQLSYRLDFYFQMTIWFFFSLTPYIGLQLLFSNFKTIGGMWNVWHVGIFYGILGIAYDASRMIGRSFDSFHKYILSGNLDIFFVRPLPIYLQLLFDQLFLRRIAGITQYVFVLFISYYNLKESIPTEIFIVTAIVTIISNFQIFLGLVTLYAGTCIFTIERNSFTDLVVDLSMSTGFYPTDFLNKPLKLFFTWIIPFYLSAYFPLKSLFFLKVGNLQIAKLLFQSFLVGTIFYVASFIFFNLSLKKYQSSNTNMGV